MHSYGASIYRGLHVGGFRNIGKMLSLIVSNFIDILLLKDAEDSGILTQRFAHEQECNTTWK